MSERLTNILGYLTLAAILAAIWILFGEDPTRDQGARGEATFAGLSERVNETATIHVIKADGSITLAKEGDAWRVRERSDFPADITKVREFLRGFALSERREPKTGNPDRFHRLGLADEAASVHLKDDAGGILLSVKVGTRKGSNNGRSLTYIFQETDTRAWLVTGLEEMSIDPAYWLDTELLNIEGGRFASIRMNDVVLSRESGEAEYGVEGAQENASLAPAWQRAQAAQALAALRIEDVQMLNNPLSDPVSTIAAKTHDGLTLEAALFEYEGGNWIQLRATFDANARNEGGAAVLQGAPEDGAAEAATINERTRGWLFKISDVTAQSLKRRKADFIETTETSNAPS